MEHPTMLLLYWLSAGFPISHPRVLKYLSWMFHMINYMLVFQLT